MMFWNALASATNTASVQDSTPKMANAPTGSNVNNGPAPPPAPPPAGDKRPSGPQVSDCLCVFDVDRTLTAKQGWYDCPATEAHNDVPDWAYNGGSLILSDLALAIKDSDACGR